MPRLKPNQMGYNHNSDGAWCPGCGLHHHVTGQHRTDCTKGIHHRATDECDDPKCPCHTFNRSDEGQHDDEANRTPA